MFLWQNQERFMDPNTPTVHVTAAKCVECGKTFPTAEMIWHRDVFVCANCKPIFVQKLAEGAEIRFSKLQYAGFWRRFAAAFIDGLIVLVVNYVMVFVGLPLGVVIGGFLPYVAGALYETLLIGAYGATVGKTVCKIRIVTADGGQVSYARALGRYFAKILSAFTLLIGYIIAAFDEEHRTLHDRICDTRVILG
jgi:uncharacterized RDD family membrane protein YckC